LAAIRDSIPAPDAVSAEVGELDPAKLPLGFGESAAIDFRHDLRDELPRRERSRT